MKILEKVMIISTVFVGVMLLAAANAAVVEVASKSSPSRKSYTCGANQTDEIICKRYGTLVKMWECGEGEYRVTDQSVANAADSACTKYLKLKPKLELQKEVIQEILNDPAEREKLKEQLKAQLKEQLEN